MFDGYESSSTKDMTHQRRSKGKYGTTVTFEPDMVLTMKKEHFLANKQNKQQFISMLSDELQKANCETHHASGDADLLIVQKAIQCATTTNTVLIGDDTDLLVLLCYHASIDSHDLLFCSEARKSTKKSHIWNIKATKQLLGPDICKHILFLHAILGCDTTSRLHGIGKGTSLKKFKESDIFREQAEVFYAHSASTDDVAEAGERAMVILYNGKCTDTLDMLRYHRFCEKVASSSSYIQPQVLPPTSVAAKYHSLRVYLQVQEWKGSLQRLNPINWGWQKCDEGFLPIQTTLPPAPENLLKVIKCNCHGDCSTLRCTCKKNNLECTPACGHCRGSSCINSVQMHCEEDEDDILRNSVV